ncbi:MAG: NINE protein [Phormidesmis sp.]
MPISTPSVLELAKQGNSKAISVLINRQLQPRGITAKASLKSGCLQILVEAAEVPVQADLTAFIQKGLVNLKIAQIEQVKIYGKSLSEELPNWDYRFDLNVEEDNPFKFEQYESNKQAPHSEVQDLGIDKRETFRPFEAIGKNGKITLTAKRISISREGFWGFLSQGSAGVKEIPINNVTAVQFKTSGDITVGYLQFSILGGLEQQGGVLKAVNDENTVTFLPGQQANFEEVKRYVDSILDEEPISLATLKHTDPTISEAEIKAKKAEVEANKPFWERKVFSPRSNNKKQALAKPPRKLVVGICAILFGFLGVHKFLLDYKLEGAILLCTTMLSGGVLMFIPVCIGIAEGVIYLRKSDTYFHKRYVTGKRKWF